MKTNFTKELALIALSLIPIGYLAYVWPQLPQTVPTHFRMNGTPNGYSSKQTLVWLTVGLNIFIYLMMRYINRVDPRYKQKDIQSSSYDRIRVGVSLLICAITCITVNAGLNGAIAGGPNFLIIILLLFFAFLGNNLGSLQPNYFIGVRTPWTLENEVVWRKTHRLTGKLWFFGAIILLPLVFIIPNEYSSKLVMFFIFGTALASIGYSYIIYTQEMKKK